MVSTNPLKARNIIIFHTEGHFSREKVCLNIIRKYVNKNMLAFLKTSLFVPLPLSAAYHLNFFALCGFKMSKCFLAL